jgi:hypothetical protein
MIESLKYIYYQKSNKKNSNIEEEIKFQTVFLLLYVFMLKTQLPSSKIEGAPPYKLLVSPTVLPELFPDHLYKQFRVIY